ncbi:MAG: hypothetical protein R3C19_21015 [Planctomycetaceae bacterium]
MNRQTVLSGLIVAMLLPIGLAPSAVAQNVRYTIGGDADQPDSYSYAAGQPVHLRDLVQSSGTQLFEGSAVILRDSPPRPIGSEFIREGQADAGSLLAPGDIVLLHRAAPTDAGGNVVLVTDDLPLVLQFDGRTELLERLLEGLQTTIPPDAAIPAIRTEQGRPVSLRLMPSDSVRHGDVLLLASVVTVSGQRISEIFNGQQPTWQRGPQTGPAVHIGHPSVELRETTIVPEALDTQRPLTFPTGLNSAPPMTTASLQTTSDAGDTASITTGGGLLIPGMAGGAAQPSAPSVSANAGAMSANDEFTSTASKADTAESAALTAALNDAFPKAASDSNSAFWNLVFIAGLVMSLGLVVSGWLKSRAEHEQRAERDSKLSRFVSPKTAIDRDQTGHNEASDELAEDSSSLLQYMQTSAAESVMPKLQTREEAPAADIEDAATISQDQIASEATAPPRALVGDVEWFGGEWISSAAPSGIASDSCPTDERDETRAEMVACDSTDEIRRRPAMMDSAVMKSAAMDPAAMDEISDTSETIDALEAMIQNRLPINLQVADLPLRIALFGRPAGPRRLRIDAAHQGVPAPHMNTAGRNANRPAQQATAAGSSVSAASSSATKPMMSGETIAPSASPSHLDRALNSLQEPTES